MSLQSAPAGSPARSMRAPRAKARSVCCGLSRGRNCAPGLVFGQEDNFFDRFGWISRISPDAGDRRQNAHWSLLCRRRSEAIEAALAGRATEGDVYEFGGPVTYTFRELLKKVASGPDIRAPYPIPAWMAKIPAFFVRIVPGAPLAVDQIRLLRATIL